MAYITLQDVTHAYGRQVVLNHVSVAFDEGKIHGIVGNNGSGKTQLLKAICGYLPITSGAVFVRGKQVGKDFDFPPDMGVIIETPGFLPHQTAKSNLTTLWSLRGKPKKDKIDLALATVGLSDTGKKHVGKFSLGMRQRLGIAQAIMEEPSLLILDEPFNGLDKQAVLHMHELFLQLKEKGVTFLLTSHSSEDIDVLCDTVHEMEAGSISRIR